MKEKIAPSDVILSYAQLAEAKKNSLDYDNSNAARMKPCQENVINQFVMQIFKSGHCECLVYAYRMGFEDLTFSKMIQALTGYSPVDWRNYAVVVMAQEKLAETKKSLFTISEEVGLSTCSNFIRFFTREVGIPPSKWRNENRNFTAEADLKALAERQKTYKSIIKKLQSKGMSSADIADLLDLKPETLSKLLR